MSPIISFLVTWVLPLVIFYGARLVHVPQDEPAHGRQRHELRQVQRQDLRRGADRRDALPTWPGEDEAKDALQGDRRFPARPGQNIPRHRREAAQGRAARRPSRHGQDAAGARPWRARRKVPFFSISGSEFVEMFVGMGAAQGARPVQAGATKRRRASSSSTRSTRSAKSATPAAWAATTSASRR